MIRVLQSVNIMDRAGLETMLMNYYRNMDHELIQFDFLTHRDKKGAYEDEIKALGGIIYRAPRLYIQNIPSYFQYMKKFFAEHSEYSIIHSHIDAMSAFPLKAAKKSNIPNRITHSHSSKFDTDLKLLIKIMAMKTIPKLATEYCACGDVAGKFMFKDKSFKIIRNAIELDKFIYNPAIRERKRKELKIENKFVIGNVGRYCYIKNQSFVLDVFKIIVAKIPDSHLLLVGKGEDHQSIIDKIAKLDLEGKVSLLIDRSDVCEIYQTLDVFLMPSLFEGLPLVGVEAQANGLPCFVSNNISREVLLTNNIQMLDLSQGAQYWAEQILKSDIRRNKNAKKQLQIKGYDVIVEAKKLQNWYLELACRQI